MESRIKEFYQEDTYIDHVAKNTEQSAVRKWMPFFSPLVDKYLDRTDKILEVGCGRGLLSTIHQNYFGVDISYKALPKNCSSFMNGNVSSLPIKSDSFKMIISNRVLEHIPDPEKALREYERVLQVGGILVLNDAWFCRQYICYGLNKKKFSSLSFYFRIYKCLIPLIEWKPLRMSILVSRRIFREISNYIKPIRGFKYKKLKASYDEFYGSDSDACSSIDPHSVITFFRNRGSIVLSHPSLSKRILCRKYIVVRIQK